MFRGIESMVSGGSHSGLGIRAIGIFVFAMLAASPAAAQVDLAVDPVPACTAFDRTQIIEWDVETLAADSVPSALVVDRENSRRSRVYFATKTGDSARLYRLTPGLNMKKNSAEAKSWDLGSFFTGGLRLRPAGDGRLFVNATLNFTFEGGIVALDANANTRTTWMDRPFLPQISDITVTGGSSKDVFTAAPEYTPLPTSPVVLTGGVVQRLRPGKPNTWKNPDGTTTVPAEVTRWQVGGLAGTCDEGSGSPTAPCIPGVTVDRHGKVFVSEPEFVFKDGRTGAIGELDTKLVACPTSVTTKAGAVCSLVRHWPLPSPKAGPRQLLLDDDGVVWVITTSGEIFALRIDRYSNKGWVERHNPLPAGTEYMYAVAPDGAIGFTDSNGEKVALLFPKNNAKPVTPEPQYVLAEKGTIDGIRKDVYPATHPVTPVVAKADTFIYTLTDDGTYRETNIATGKTDKMAPTGSNSPTGMAVDIARKTGSFYYGVGFRAMGAISHRIGLLVADIEPEREMRHRRDDDDFDHDGVDNGHDGDDDDDDKQDIDDDDDDNDCIPDGMDHDKDNDGIHDDDDSGDRETMKKDSGSFAPGQVLRYDMETDANSLALVAVVEATDITAPFVIDIVNPAGSVVLSVPSVAGKAVATATPALSGFYTIQVRNTSLKSIAYKTTIIGRSIWF
jgi:hypothetical protein